MDKSVKLTLYVDPDLKKRLFAAAEKARPRTSATGLGSHLLDEALQKYEESLKEKEKTF